MNVVFGVDGGLARGLVDEGDLSPDGQCKHEDGCGHGQGEGHKHHQSEVEVLSVELRGEEVGAAVDADKLLGLLRRAPKDEVYRIKAVLTASGTVRNSDEDVPMPTPTPAQPRNRYILNWAFGRWTFTPVGDGVAEHDSSSNAALRMTMILARYESTKWKKKLEAGGLLELEGTRGLLMVTKVN
jgi:hypothetical protein